MCLVMKIVRAPRKICRAAVTEVRGGGRGGVPLPRPAHAGAVRRSQTRLLTASICHGVLNTTPAAHHALHMSHTWYGPRGAQEMRACARGACVCMGTRRRGVTHHAV